MATLARSASAVILMQYGIYVLAFVRLAVVSRLLSSAEIGAFLLASSLVLLASVPRTFGIQEFIISTKDPDNEVFRTCFTIVLVAAAVVTGLYMLGAGAAENFFDAPELAEMLRLMSLSFVVLTFGLIANAVMRREMRFFTLAGVRISSAITETVVSLSLLFAGFGVMSMAWGYLAANVVALFIWLFVAPRLILFRPGIARLREILSFGWRASIGTLLSQIGDIGPPLVLGRGMDAASVGYFGRGQSLVSFLKQGLETALGPVTQPWFARKSRDDTHSLSTSYLRLMAIVCAITWPAYALVAAHAHTLVPLVLGDQWDASIPITQALAVGAMFSPFAQFGLNLLAGTGQVGRRMQFGFLSQGVRFALLIAAIPFGLVAFAWTLAATHFLGFLMMVGFLRKDIQLGGFAVLSTLWSSLALGIAVALLNFGVLALLPDHFSSLVALAGLTGASAILWIGLAFALKHPIIPELRNIVSRVRAAQ